MPKQYVVKLSPQDRLELESLWQSRSGSARQQARVQGLLLSDDGWSDEEIAEEVDLHSSSVERLRKRCCLEGWTVAVGERPRSGRPPMLDAKQEAVLVALACEKPAKGRRRWTLRQLGERLVGLEVVESISHETVRRVLKKTNSSPGRNVRGACRR